MKLNIKASIHSLPQPSFPFLFIHDNAFLAGSLRGVSGLVFKVGFSSLFICLGGAIFLRPNEERIEWQYTVGVFLLSFISEINKLAFIPSIYLIISLNFLDQCAGYLYLQECCSAFMYLNDKLCAHAPVT